MPDPEHIDINVGEGVKFGVFANAFRVVEDLGTDCLLDFMVYSAAEKEATVVARVRVRRDFLEGIRGKLGDAIATFGEENGVVETAVVGYQKATRTTH
jgi:hypothetical protein